MRCLAIVYSVALLFAQEPPTFCSSTQLVEMSVIALDKKGRPVKDLKVEEIELQDGGKTRRAAVWRYEGVMPPAPPPMPGAARVFTNYGERATTDHHLIMVVLDALNS